MNQAPNEHRFVGETSDTISHLSAITKGAGITLVGTIIGKLLLFVYIVFLARYLQQDEFGIYILGTTLIVYLSSLSDLGLNVSSTRYVAIYMSRNDPNRLKGVVITACIITSLVSISVVLCVTIFSDFIACHFFHEPKLASVLKVLSISLPFECLMRTFLRSTQGLKLMHYTAVTENVLWYFLRIIITFTLIYTFQMGLDAATWAYTISSVLSCFVAYLCLRKHIPLFNKHVKAIYEARMLLRFSVPMVISVFLGNVSRQIDILMLGLFVSTTDIALYNPSGRLIALAEFVYQAFNPIFNPFVSELTDKREFGKLNTLLKIITRWNVIVSLPIFLCLIFFPGIFLLMFGSNFVEAAPCLVILSIAHLLSSLSSLPSTMIFMSGRPDLTAKNNVLILILNVGLNYFLIPPYGIVGAAISTGISLALLATLRISEVYHLMEVHPFSFSLWKPALSSICALPIIYIALKLLSPSLTHTLTQNILTICMFLFSYFFFLFLFRLNKEDRDILYLVRRKAIATINCGLLSRDY